MEQASRYLRPSTTLSMTRTPRFFDVGKKSQQVIPGPSQYSPEKPSKRMPSPRFGTSRRNLDPITQTPGPNLYDINDTILSKVKTTPRFSFPRSPRGIESEHRTTTNPVAYNPNYDLGKKGNTKNVIFPKAEKELPSKETSSSTPGPGMYGVPRLNMNHIREPAFSFPRAPGRNTQDEYQQQKQEEVYSGTNRRFGSALLSKEKRSPVAKFGRSVRLFSTPTTSPGPGYYSPNYTAIQKNNPKPVLYLTG